MNIMPDKNGDAMQNNEHSIFIISPEEVTSPGYNRDRQRASDTLTWRWYDLLYPRYSSIRQALWPPHKNYTTITRVEEL